MNRHSFVRQARALCKRGVSFQPGLCRVCHVAEGWPGCALCCAVPSYCERFLLHCGSPPQRAHSRGRAHRLNTGARVRVVFHHVSCIVHLQHCYSSRRWLYKFRHVNLVGGGTAGARVDFRRFVVQTTVKPIPRGDSCHRVVRCLVAC